MKYLTRKEELLLLTIHRLKNNAYLVKIKEYLNKHTDKEWTIGNLYVPLDKLKNEGYLDSEIGEATAKRGGRAIRYYRLSNYGMKALAETKKLNDFMWEGQTDIAPEK